MSRCSRRDFIVRSGAAGATAMGAQGLLTEQAQAAGNHNQMAIAKWNGRGTPDEAKLKQIAEELTEKVVAAIGGMERFIKSGDVVWVKPNMAWDRRPELANNTNPDVVATLVRLCFQAGAKTVKVGDNTCDIARKAYKTNGIAAAAKAAGAEVVFLDRRRFRNTDIGGSRLKTIPVYPEILECDFVLNVPVVKDHGATKVSLCMKNYMGVADQRLKFHQAINDSIVDITRFMKPQMCVLDGIRILTKYGPNGGTLADVKLKTTVAAGVDIVALDAWGAELLGMKPDSVKTIVKGQQAGLGTIDYRKLKPQEIVIS